MLHMVKMQDALSELTERNITMEKLIREMARKQEGASSTDDATFI